MAEVKPESNDDSTALRKHMYLITEHRDEEQVGNILIQDRMLGCPAGTNEEGISSMRNRETGETWTRKQVSLGYHDFEDDQDYEENIVDVMHDKLADLDDRHLDKAGIEREEIGA